MSREETVAGTHRWRNVLKQLNRPRGSTKSLTPKSWQTFQLHKFCKNLRNTTQSCNHSVRRSRPTRLGVELSQKTLSPRSLVRQMACSSIFLRQVSTRAALKKLSQAPKKPKTTSWFYTRVWLINRTFPRFL